MSAWLRWRLTTNIFTRIDYIEEWKIEVNGPCSDAQVPLMTLPKKNKKIKGERDRFDAWKLYSSVLVTTHRTNFYFFPRAMLYFKPFVKMVSAASFFYLFFFFSWPSWVKLFIDFFTTDWTWLTLMSLSLSLIRWTRSRHMILLEMIHWKQLCMLSIRKAAATVYSWRSLFLMEALKTGQVIKYKNLM